MISNVTEKLFRVTSCPVRNYSMIVPKIQCEGIYDPRRVHDMKAREQCERPWMGVSRAAEKVTKEGPVQGFVCTCA